MAPFDFIQTYAVWTKKLRAPTFILPQIPKVFGGVSASRTEGAGLSFIFSSFKQIQSRLEQQEQSNDQQE